MSKNIFDMITIGESLRDVFYMIDEATISCSIDKNKCLLCLEYAEKIPVKHVVKIPAAGNAANAAVAASRLGLKTALISWAGDDFSGHDMKEHIKKENIDVRLMCTCQKEQTSEATLLSYQGERTQMIFFKNRDYKLPKMPKTRCVYYTAMGNKFSRFDRELGVYLDANPDIMFAFQPGTTHIRAGLKAMKALIKRTDILVMNLNEARLVLDGGERPVTNLLHDFNKLGARIVVITDGKNGAYAYDGKKFLMMPIIPGQATERTGAGDAFASTLAISMVRGATLEEALKAGSINAWSVIKEIGPQKGLLNLKQMDKIIKRFAKTNAKRLSDKK